MTPKHNKISIENFIFLDAIECPDKKGVIHWWDLYYIRGQEVYYVTCETYSDAAIIWDYLDDTKRCCPDVIPQELFVVADRLAREKKLVLEPENEWQ